MMSQAFEELDYQKTPLGDLSLRRRLVPALDNLEVFEVKLGDAFLMSSMFHEVEVALANLGLNALEPGAWDVVVGGLGLGYTAATALEHKQVTSLIVVDALESVITWHKQHMVPLGPVLSGDPRCRFVHADFFALAQSPEGFDPENKGRRFHAVLLDIDHSPKNLLDPANGRFYTEEGLRWLAKQLLPGGVFALWSDDPPDDEFQTRLARIFARVNVEVVQFANPLLDRESASTVYVAAL